MSETRYAIRCNTEEEILKCRGYRAFSLDWMEKSIKEKGYTIITYKEAKDLGLLGEKEEPEVGTPYMDYLEKKQETPRRETYRITIEDKFEVSFDYKGYLSNVLVQKIESKQETPSEYPYYKDKNGEIVIPSRDKPSEPRIRNVDLSNLSVSINEVGAYEITNNPPSEEEYTLEQYEQDCKSDSGIDSIQMLIPSEESKIRIDYLNKEREVRHIFTDGENVGWEITTILNQGATDVHIYLNNQPR